MKNYKNSKTRLVFLLAMCLVICYNIYNSTGDNQLLGVLVLGINILALKSWMEE